VRLPSPVSARRGVSSADEPRHDQVRQEQAYLGEAIHKGKSYAGERQPIIDGSDLG
jgi:hypothetical protein